MEGNDVFVLSVTHWEWKVSMFLRSAAFAFDDLFQRDGSIVVVVSPLIALVKDQVAEIITLHVHVHRSCVCYHVSV